MGVFKGRFQHYVIQGERSTLPSSQTEVTIFTNQYSGWYETIYPLITGEGQRPSDPFKNKKIHLNLIDHLQTNCEGLYAFKGKLLRCKAKVSQTD